MKYLPQPTSPSPSCYVRCLLLILELDFQLGLRHLGLTVDPPSTTANAYRRANNILLGSVVPLGVGRCPRRVRVGGAACWANPERG
jgi:hypothetical protein